MSQTTEPKPPQDTPTTDTATTSTDSQTSSIETHVNPRLDVKLRDALFHPSTWDGSADTYLSWETESRRCLNSLGIRNETWFSTSNTHNAHAQSTNDDGENTDDELDEWSEPGQTTQSVSEQQFHNQVVSIVLSWISTDVKVRYSPILARISHPRSLKGFLRSETLSDIHRKKADLLKQLNNISYLGDPSSQTPLEDLSKHITDFENLISRLSGFNHHVRKTRRNELLLNSIIDNNFESVISSLWFKGPKNLSLSEIKSNLFTTA